MTLGVGLIGYGRIGAMHAGLLLPFGGVRQPPKLEPSAQTPLEIVRQTADSFTNLGMK